MCCCLLLFVATVVADAAVVIVVNDCYWLLLVAGCCVWKCRNTCVQNEKCLNQVRESEKHASWSDGHALVRKFGKRKSVASTFSRRGTQVKARVKLDVAGPPAGRQRPRRRLRLRRNYRSRSRHGGRRRGWRHACLPRIHNPAQPFEASLRHDEADDYLVP